MNSNQLTTLRQMHAWQRIKAMHPGHGQTRFAELATTLQGLIDAKPDPAAQAKRIMASWGDPAVKRELCEVRVTTVNNFIRAAGKFLNNFFVEKSLGDSDRPAFQNESKNEISCGYISQDGRPRSIKTVNPQTEALVDLRLVSSEVVGYFIRDIYNGNVATAAQRTFDIGFDLTFKIDRLAKSLMTASLSSGGVFGAFTTTGTKQDRVYVAHSGVETANLPTTNDIVLDADNYLTWGAEKYNAATAESATTANRFRLDVMRAVQSYCTKWADVLNGPLTPTGLIIVPSGDALGLLKEVTVTSNTFNDVAQGLLHNFLSVNFAGVQWTIIPDATLPSGVCYPILDRPVGEYYVKSSWDDEDVKTDKAKNWEERFQTKLVGFATPSPWRPHAVRVTYKA